MRGKTGRVSTEIHGGFFHVLKIEEQPEIRFRSREGFCLASLGCQGNRLGRLYRAAGPDHSVRQEVLNIKEPNRPVAFIDNDELIDLALLDDAAGLLRELLRSYG